jgi:aspartate/methionine/tyrosine aminotransferase
VPIQKWEFTAMNIKPFALERYFAHHEFSARHLLSCSDCEPLSLTALLESADSECLHMWEKLKLGYTESQGLPLLREQIAAIYPTLKADHIIVAAPEECIFLLMHTLLNKDDHVICTYPGYQSLYAVAQAMGCRVSLWCPDEERGWHFNPARLAEMMDGVTRLVVVNFPHNPTGSLATADDQAALVAQCRQAGAYLFSDEMYRFLEFDAARRLPAACDLYEKAVSLGGLSKSFGLPGLRIGWLATRDERLLESLSRLKDYTTICNAAPSEVLALMALRGREGILATQQQRLQRNMAVLESFFNTYAEDITWQRPPAGSIGFPRLLTDENADRFCAKLLQETGIMLVPSTIFDYGNQHVRIGFGRQDLPRVIERFADYMASCHR